jgi:hypothetical protein
MMLDNETKQELVDLLKSAVLQAVEVHPLSDDEVQWVRMAIKAEADRAELRKAIIEKTLIGLVWFAVVGILGLIWSGVKDHIAVH